MNTLDKTKQSSPNNHQLEKLKADNNKDVVSNKNDLTSNIRNVEKMFENLKISDLKIFS